MKKTFVTILFLSTISLFTQAQDKKVRLSLRSLWALSPNLVQDKNQAPVDTVGYGKYKSGLGFSVGPTLEFYFGENYSFSTGLWYANKRAGLTYDIKSTPAGGGAVKQVTIEQAYRLQYVQIPVAFKLYTNEIVGDLKAYIQLGTTLDIAIAKAKQKILQRDEVSIVDTKYEAKFRPFDLSLLTTIGVEKPLGDVAILYGGFCYNRGFMNLLQKEGYVNRKEGVKYGTRLAGLEVGIKF